MKPVVTKTIKRQIEIPKWADAEWRKAWQNYRKHSKRLKLGKEFSQETYAHYLGMVLKNALEFKHDL